MDENEKPNEELDSVDTDTSESECVEDESGGECSNRFRNKLLYLPSDVLTQVNEAIERGWRSGHIHSLLRTRFVDKIKESPSRSTVEKYVKWYLANKDKAAKEEQSQDLEVQLLNSEVTELKTGIDHLADDKTPLFDKHRMLELLVQKSVRRISTIERWQKTNLNPAMENCMIRYFGEIRNLIEILAKLNNEIKPDKEIIVNIIDSKIQPMVMSFYKVIQIIAPDKIEVAKALLKDEMKKMLAYASTVKAEDK
jgi:hypothetical protein